MTPEEITRTKITMACLASVAPDEIEVDIGESHVFKIPYRTLGMWFVYSPDAEMPSSDFLEWHIWDCMARVDEMEDKKKRK